MQDATFNHERLQVYQAGLRLVGELGGLVGAWDRRHAIADQLPRAVESIVENLAEGCRAHAMKAKHTAVDYSIGSTLECAACIDVAGVKGLLSHDAVRVYKRELIGVCRQLVALRDSWTCNAGHESARRQGARPDDGVFLHEKLDAYQVALSFMQWFCGSGSENMPSKVWRRMDADATSIVLNIAEGNGRFAELDQCRFLGISNRAAVRLAAQLDICGEKRILDRNGIAEGKTLLVRVASMTAAMAGKR